MAITKEKNIDQITVESNGFIYYKETTKIIEDGNLLTQTYNRGSFYPGESLIGVDSKIVAIAEAVWTSEVLAAYEASKQEPKDI